MRIPSPVTRRKARIEIVPLIDIVFFLLATFVMVSMAMIKNKGIPVNLPVATTAAPQEQQSSIVLTVTENGELFINKTQIALESLSTHLKEKMQSEPDLKVFIHGDDRASFGAAIQVLDEVRKLGITKVAIQTASKDEVSGEKKPL